MWIFMNRILLQKKKKATITMTIHMKNNWILNPKNPKTNIDMKSSGLINKYYYYRNNKKIKSCIIIGF